MPTITRSTTTAAAVSPSTPIGTPSGTPSVAPCAPPRAAPSVRATTDPRQAPARRPVAPRAGSARPAKRLPVASAGVVSALARARPRRTRDDPDAAPGGPSGREAPPLRVAAGRGSRGGCGRALPPASLRLSLRPFPRPCASFTGGARGAARRCPRRVISHPARSRSGRAGRGPQGAVPSCRGGRPSGPAVPQPAPCYGAPAPGSAPAVHGTRAGLRAPQRSSGPTRGGLRSAGECRIGGQNTTHRRRWLVATAHLASEGHNAFSVHLRWTVG
jgi:hypothetical protein